MDHGVRPEHFALLRQLDGVARTSGDPAQDQAYETLVEAYEATAAWARAVQQRLFADGFVRKLSRPTDMAQKFKPYTWVRIYPRRNAPKALAYTVGIDADGEFCVKLDTVQINGTAVRDRYDELRHYDNHLSPFAAIISAETGLAMSFEELVDWSIDAIGGFEPGYDALALELGLIEPRMQLITDPAQSRAAFARWAEAIGGPVGGGVFKVADHNVWMKAVDGAAGIDARLGLDSSGSEWAVEINAPPQPGDHNRLAGIAEDLSGGLHLLRQGWLRGRRPAPDIREDDFARLTGLTPVPVVATGRAAARRWFLVASLDDPPERIRRTTAHFVARCEAARSGGTATGDGSVSFVADLDQLFANVATLETVRAAGSDGDRGAYLSLIRRGTCFLPYATRDGIAFAPSRFIGYADNSFAKHAANEARDGRLTNTAINAILGYAPTLEPALEEAYERFCLELGFTPSQTGTFGVARKYWLTADIRDRLDLLAEQEVIADPALTATQKDQLIQARIGQGEFRRSLLDAWNARCCVTDCAIHQVLRASHIKPWRASDNKERLDPFNGLLLVANVDALFDRFLISFGDDGAMLYGPDIGRDDLIALGCDPDRRVAVSARHAPYLAWHRAEYRARGGKG
jgi:hypothetical protein